MVCSIYFQFWNAFPSNCTRFKWNKNAFLNRFSLHGSRSRHQHHYYHRFRICNERVLGKWVKSFYTEIYVCKTFFFIWDFSKNSAYLWTLVFLILYQSLNMINFVIKTLGIGGAGGIKPVIGIKHILKYQWNREFCSLSSQTLKLSEKIWIERKPFLEKFLLQKFWVFNIQLYVTDTRKRHKKFY